jgi:hypothetical protein
MADFHAVLALDTEHLRLSGEFVTATANADYSVKVGL